MDPPRCPCTRPRTKALEAELSGSNGAASTNGRADAPRVVVLFCHAEREDVFALLERLGARQVDAADGLRGHSRRASRTSAAADRGGRRWVRGSAVWPRGSAALAPRPDPDWPSGSAPRSAPRLALAGSLRASARAGLRCSPSVHSGGCRP